MSLSENEFYVWVDLDTGEDFALDFFPTTEKAQIAAAKAIKDGFISSQKGEVVVVYPIHRVRSLTIRKKES